MPVVEGNQGVTVIACACPEQKLSLCGAIPNFATEKEPKRNFLYLTDVTLVIVDIKSGRFIKRTVYSRTCLI